MSNLDCPLFGSVVNNEINSCDDQKHKHSFGIHCNYCSKRIKTGSLIGCHRFDDDFMNFNYTEKLFNFCDLICAKLYDINIHNLALDLRDYRKKFLTNQLEKKSIIIYNQVKNILFTQMPIKYCNPVTKKDFEYYKNEYIKIL